MTQYSTITPSDIWAVSTSTTSSCFSLNKSTANLPPAFMEFLSLVSTDKCEFGLDDSNDVLNDLLVGEMDPWLINAI